MQTLIETYQQLKIGTGQFPYPKLAMTRFIKEFVQALMAFNPDTLSIAVVQPNGNMASALSPDDSKNAKGSPNQFIQQLAQLKQLQAGIGRFATWRTIYPAQFDVIIKDTLKPLSTKEMLDKINFINDEIKKQIPRLESDVKKQHQALIEELFAPVVQELEKNTVKLLIADNIQNNNMANVGKNDGQRATYYQEQYQQLLKLRAKQAVIKKKEIELEATFEKLLNEKTVGNNKYDDLTLKKIIKDAFMQKFDEISKKNESNIVAIQSNLADYRASLRASIEDKLKQPTPKIIVIKLVDPFTRKIAGYSSGQHLKAIFHDGINPPTYVSFGAGKVLDEDKQGVLAKGAGLLHLPGKDRQGHFNSYNADLIAFEKDEGSVFDLEVVDCDVIGSHDIGLSYDKAIQWVQEQKQKPEEQLTYNFLSTNCAFYVTGALKAAGASEIAKPDYSAAIIDTPIPEDAFQYVKKLNSVIAQKKNKQQKQHLDHDALSLNVLPQAVDVKQHQKSQFDVQRKIFNTLYVGLDSNKMADQEIVIAVKKGIDILDELDNINNLVDPSNAKSSEDAKCVQNRILINSINHFAQIYAEKAMPEKVSIVVESLKELLPFFPPAENDFFSQVRKEIIDKNAVATKRFHEEIFKSTTSLEELNETDEIIHNDNGELDGIKKYLEEWEAQLGVALDSEEPSPFKMALRIRNVIKWVEHKQVESILLLEKLEKKKFGKTGAAANRDEKAIQAEEAELVKAIERVNKLANYQENTINFLQEASGKLNCYIYSDNPKMAATPASAKIHPRDVLGVGNYEGSPVDFAGSLTFAAKQIFKESTVARPTFWDSVWGTILPWKTATYNETMRKITNKSIGDILFGEVGANGSSKAEVNNKGKAKAKIEVIAEDNVDIKANVQAKVEAELHPYIKFEKIKQKIAENKPSVWNIFRSSERKIYEKMENQAQLVCLLEAFGKGYLDEERLGKQLIDLANKEGVENAQQIKLFTKNLQYSYQENKNVLGDRDFTIFKAAGIREELNTSAKLLQLFHHDTGGIPVANPKKAVVAEKIIGLDKNQPVLQVDPQNNKKLSEIEKDLAVLREPHW